jgi:phosphatidate cytidylyltransferase
MSHLSALVTLFVLATGGCLWLTWRRPIQSLARLGSCIHFLWLMAAMIVLAIADSSKILIVYIAFLAFLSLKAYLSITPTRRTDRRVLLWAYLSIPIQFALIGLGWYWSFLFFTPIFIFVILPVRMVIAGQTRGFVRAWSILSWGLLSTVFSLGCLAHLLVLPMSQATPAGGFGLFLYLMILIQLNYAIQLYLGMRFGYPRLSFAIGATRNWASLAGSLLVVVPAAWLAAPLLTPFSTIESIFIGLLVAAGGLVGYIVLSAIKGDCQLKGRGTMTRGRGVLNRIDAIVYTAPLYFFIVSNLYH